MSESTQRLKLRVKTIGQIAEVVNALAKEFERQPRPEILVTLKSKIESLGSEWEKTEAILRSKE
jgi:hypothetical protein